MGNPQSGPQHIELPPMAVNAAALRFYSKHFGTLAICLVAMIVLNAGLIAWHMFQERREVDREYFGLDFKSGRMVRLIPLGEPYLSNQSLLTRVKECIQDANTYDFVNYQKTFTKTSECFTDDGWAAFITELNRVGTFKAVKSNRLVAQAVANGVPVITQPGHLRGGVLTWEIQMPVQVKFVGGEGGRGLATQNLLVTATVQRVPEYKNEYGIGIAQYVAEERRP